MKTQAYWLDLGERVVMTFLQAFCASWLVTQSLDADDLKVAATAGLLALAKCIAASRMGDRDTASTVD